MRLFNICVFLISFTAAQIGLGQAPSPLDFFPHHLGDLWEYWWQEIPPGYIIVQNEITKDSLGNDGLYYIETTRQVAPACKPNI